MNDTISRHGTSAWLDNMGHPNLAKMIMDEKRFPSAQPEPISDAYMKAVWTWLIDYQIKTAELKGRYTPYEVLSWVANDWRREHERSNQQTSDEEHDY